MYNMYWHPVQDHPLLPYLRLQQHLVSDRTHKFILSLSEASFSTYACVQNTLNQMYPSGVYLKHVSTIQDHMYNLAEDEVYYAGHLVYTFTQDALYAALQTVGSVLPPNFVVDLIKAHLNGSANVPKVLAFNQCTHSF